MSAWLYDKIPVIDLECTCYENNEFPKGDIQEIIEIGVALLDVQTLEVERAESILIPPTRSVISPFCTELTSLTPEMFDKGKSKEQLWTYEDACQHLQRTYLTHQRTWASWGDFDKAMFQRQSTVFRTLYPFGHSHINAKALTMLFTNRKKSLGMLKALRIAQIEHHGRHHRGVDDAVNIAKLLAWILRHGRKY